MSESKNKLRKYIKRYFQWGAQLFPIKSKEKTPLELNWNTKSYSERDLLAYISRGCNIGWALGDTDLVIDIDPRHPKTAEGLKHLNGKGDWIESCPCVRTGGSDRGYHYYTKIPSDCKVKSRSEYFPDVHFQHKGQYVLIAGCRHPDTDRLYEFDLLSPIEIPNLPNWVLDKLITQLSPLKDQDHAGQTILTLDQIKSYLSYLDPIKYRDYDAWLSIGMAIHSASGADPEAEALWISWSTSDPLYLDAENIARQKWQSFSDRSSGRTAATLIAEAIKYGAKPTNYINAVDDFDQPIESGQSYEDYKKEVMETKPLLETVIERSFAYPAQWDDLRECCRILYNTRLTTIDRLRSEADRSRKRKRRKVNRLKQKTDRRDAAILTADRVIQTRFDKGSAIVHASNQVFYEYTGTHWEPMPNNILDRHIYECAEELQGQIADKVQFKSSTVFASTQRVLIAKTAIAGDIFRFQSEPPSVVNTQNCEVWIRGNGDIEIKEHDPKSYLLSCLNVQYDPESTCPVFDRTLLEIFEKNKQPAEMVRHFWEFFGYIMQPHKNIPTFWIWIGRGNNGKSLLVDIVSALLGSAVLPRSIKELEEGKNNHAIASLVGKLLLVDDDAPKDSTLPDSILKKLAESKQFEANPKGRDAFVFRACATPLLLYNNPPKIRDLSWGLIRKAYIVPFGRMFKPAEVNLNLKDEILGNETAGVLNRALEGYSRLRKRGHFLEPRECQTAKNDWMRKGNPLVDFIRSQTIKDEFADTDLAELYEAYTFWCSNLGGIRYPMSLQSFEVDLGQLKYKAVIEKGITVIQGVRLK